MPSCAPRLMLSVVSLYGLLPVDLRSTAAVPRLNAQLLTSLGAAHPDWDLLAISPEAKPLPGVETIGVALPASARARLRLSEPRVGRRLSGRRAATPQSFGKSLWAEAASARLAASRPDRPSTVIICTHAEAVLAVRRAMPRSRIVHWIHTAVVWGFLDAGLAADGAVVPSVAVYRMTWRSLGNQYPPPMWIIPNWLDVDAFHPPRPEDRPRLAGRARPRPRRPRGRVHRSPLDQGGKGHRTGPGGTALFRPTGRALERRRTST